MEKRMHQAPSRDEIARMGGVLLTVEDDGGDVWCFVNAAGSHAQPPPRPADADGDGDAVHRHSNKCWFPLADLDVAERPEPLQQRWRDEASVLRAQMLAERQRVEEMQEAYDAYRREANEALSAASARDAGLATSAAAAGMGASVASNRRLEDLGAQLQALNISLERVQAEEHTANEECENARGELREALARRVEVDRALSLRAREGEENREAAVEQCGCLQDVEQCKAEEEEGRSRERAYEEELAQRREQTEVLGEEAESLRARLAERLAGAAEAAEAAASLAEDSPDATWWGVLAADDGSASVRTQASHATTEEGSSAADGGGAALVRQLSTDGATVASGTEAAPSVEDNASSTSSSRHERVANAVLVPPSQPFSLHASVAWQDLASQSARVRELEGALEQARREHARTVAESESLRAEVSESVAERETMAGQGQEMAYIRNIFRKFVESLPAAGAEHDQLIPVLMTFFQFPDNETKAIMAKRQQAQPKGFWKWRGS
eukprot:NODE_4685_length_1860_cov_4.160992.p1 GENE.NODE_4685_length_1860_cov_4.160992~~NODE_4685_length_1860_cov_4.160992.p1  ORF type:complete len:562 (+),score=232.99 NODE_4685_length_1860_cov_4.160992:190-1686(+)